MKQCAVKSWSLGVLFTTLCVNGALALSSLQSEFDLTSSLSHKKIHVTVVVPESMTRSLPELLDRARRSIPLAEERMGVPLIDDFAIYFDSRPDEHNGLTTVIPTNRISVHLEAPDLESSIGLAKDYLLETLVHEMSHMIVTQQRGGAFRYLDWVVGNTSRPLGAWPRWMHEGLAVWTEGAIGGRPQSGYIDLDVRLYADFVSRKHLSPLANSDLDGSRNANRVEEGELPYHFGYLLLDKWATDSKRAKPFSDLIAEAARSPGISFRVLFRTLGPKTLDDEFKEASKNWESTPLLPETHTTEAPFATNSRILGPFVGHAPETLNWIELPISDLSQPLIRARVQGESSVRGLTWDVSFSLPLQAFAVGADRWLVVYRQNPTLSDGGNFDANLSTQRLAAIFDVHGNKVCPLSLPGKLREAALENGKLSWVRSDDAGFAYLESAPLRFTDCALGAVTTEYRSAVPFERLSAPHRADDSLSFSRLGPSSTRFDDEIVWKGRIYKWRNPLSMPQHFASGILATEFSKEHWGPVWIDFSQHGAHLRRLPMRTGSSRSAIVDLGTGPHLIVKDARWEEDRLVECDATLLKTAPIAGDLAVSDLGPVSEKTSGAVGSRSYSAWPSIFPSFWIPSIVAVSGGFAFQGESFYSDLSNIWRGGTAVGYDTFLARPYASTSLAKTELNAGPFSVAAAQIYFMPTAVSLTPGGSALVQDRWGAALRLGSSWSWGPSGWRSDLSPELSYSKGTSTSVLAGYAEWIPGFGASLQSRYAQKASSPFFKLSKIRRAFSMDARFRYLKDFESYGSAQTQFPVLSSGVYLGLEGALSSAANYPASFFQFGGLPSLSTSDVPFTTRGFPSRLANGRAILRVDTEWGFPINAPNRALSWNRSRIASVEGRVIFESVSFTSILGQRYRVGRQYFSSLGGELDVWGSVLNYVNYRASLGLFKGFGHFGGTQFVLGLRSALDL